MRFRVVLAAVAGGAVMAASVAACRPAPAGSAGATSSSSAPASTTTSDTSLDSVPFGSVGGGFTPLAGGSVASVPVDAGQTVTVPVAAQGGVPASGASAAVLAVAVMGGAAAGSVTVYAADGSQPDVPSLSWTGHDGASGLAVSALSGNGTVAVHNSSAGQVTVTLDADGYWLSGTPAAAGAFGPLAGAQLAQVRVGAGQSVTVPAAGHAGVPASGAGTVALTVAAATGFGTGGITVYPAGGRRPDVPGLTWAGSNGASGLVVSALSSGGAVAVHNSSAQPVTVTMDATGYWLSGTPAAAGTFGPIGGEWVTRVRVAAGQTTAVLVAGQAGVPASGAGAVALTLATAGFGAASVTAYPGGASPPGVPSLSDRAASGLTVSELSSTGTVALYNSSARPVTVTLYADGYWLSKGRVVSDIVAKPTTVTLTGGDIAAVSGDPAGTQTVTLAAGTPVPRVGRVVVAPSSDTAPDGLLGIVTAVSGDAVTLSPATLDQAYSTFNVSTSQALTDSDVTSSTSAGQAMTTAATPMGHPRPGAGRAFLARDLDDPTASFGYNLGDAAFSCQGSGGGPSISLTADLSKISVDLSLNADPTAPNIHFLVTAFPVFSIDVGFTDKLTCKLSDDEFLTAQIPIPGTPGLFVDLSPVVQITAEGQATIDFQWSPRAALGFDKGPGINSESHGFGSSGSVGITATADADLYLGFNVDLTLAGRIGVGGDFGPDLPASYDASTGCITVDGQLKADLTADASVFVKDWTFTLASGTFLESQLYSKCDPSPTTSSSGSTGSGSTGGPGPTGSAGSGGWTAAQPVLPSDALNSNADRMFGVSCPSTSECVATGTYVNADQVSLPLLLTRSGQSWTAAAGPPPEDVGPGAVSCPSVSECVAVDVPADGGNPIVLTWSGGSWTSTQAPMPANFSSRQAPAMTGISCPSVSRCVAVGVYEDASGNTHGLLLTWSGGSWTATEPPLPSGVSSSSSVILGQVSCASTSQCVVAASYADSYGTPHAMLLTWSGSSWTAAVPPRPADAAASNTASEVAGVSCPSVSRCFAGGYYIDTSGGQDGMLLTWSGGSWTAVTAPLPSNAQGDNAQQAYSAFVTGLSCSSASQCVATGEYNNTGFNQDGMLLTWSGSSWTAAEAPVPANAASNQQTWLTGVSCPSASQCVATGTYADTSGVTEGMLLTGPGSA
jgi:hypothetical protein